MNKQKLGKRSILTFLAILKPFGTEPSHLGSCFRIEGQNKPYVIPSGILRRNFPQAKTNTRLKVQFYPWEVDVGRTIWFRNHRGALYYTFSRRGKIIDSYLPSSMQNFLKRNLKIKSGDTVRLKIVVTAI